MSIYSPQNLEILLSKKILKCSWVNQHLIYLWELQKQKENTNWGISFFFLLAHKKIYVMNNFRSSGELGMVKSKEESKPLHVHKQNNSEKHKLLMNISAHFLKCF